jgi:adenylate cyclase
MWRWTTFIPPRHPRLSERDVVYFSSGAYTYVVKGVPGRILRKIVYAYLSNGRCEFTNKEIRLDSTLQLPDFKDNLETRLILLRRRIEERCDFLQIVSTGRGRFRFNVKRRLKLESLP